jgi:hypothetical protein
MRLFRARDRQTSPVPTAPPFDEAEAGDLAALGAEITTLEDRNRSIPDRETERRLVWLRHMAGVRLVDAGTGHVRFVEADTASLPARGATADGWLPEVGAAQLTPGLIRAGILRDGCLLVRGLIPRDAALALADGIDRAFIARERVQVGAPAAPGYYDEFRPSARYGGEILGRTWIQQGGGLLAADAPRLAFQMMELFGTARLPEIVSGYLGEPALVSAHKTTLRKAEASVPGAWHQDGFFMGPVRSLNLWLSLSRCGDEAPGLDIVPTRLETYVATATEEAKLDYTISQQRVDEARGQAPVLRPIFEPGDALFFDELFLHQTGSDPSMPKPRYAVENWFFGPSAFPSEYAPIAV